MALKPFLAQKPVLARRHYVEHGTLRYFEVRYANSGELAKAIQKETEADGLVVVALADTDAEREKALLAAKAPPFDERPDVLIAVVRPLVGLAPDLQDVMCWQWVADNTPELSQDSYASAEVARQLAICPSRAEQPLGQNRRSAKRHGDRRSMGHERGSQSKSHRAAASQP